MALAKSLQVVAIKEHQVIACMLNNMVYFFGKAEHSSRMTNSTERLFVPDQIAQSSPASRTIPTPHDVVISVVFTLPAVLRTVPGHHAIGALWCGAETEWSGRHTSTKDKGWSVVCARMLTVELGRLSEQRTSTYFVCFHVEHAT